jgi:hypothetical protein
MKGKTFVMASNIRNLIVMRAAEVMAYKNWSDDFSVSQIREIPEMVIEKKDFKPIDLSDLTREEMLDLGFGTFSKEDPMLLIPLWLLPFIKEEFDGKCINGKTGIFKRSEIDNDHRFGCLGYGVVPKKED